MITLQRTTRDYAGCVLPVLLMFAVMMTYVSLAANDLVPVVGTIYSPASWLAPILSLVIWLGLGYYVYRLFRPVTYQIVVYPERVEFIASSKPNDKTTLRRCEIRRFYMKPKKWWHAEDAIYPVMYETSSTETRQISINFVYDDMAKEFFRAITDQWDPGYTAESDAPDQP